MAPVSSHDHPCNDGQPEARDDPPSYELLDLDRRPSFIVTISKSASHEEALSFSLANPALQSLPNVHSTVKDSLVGQATNDSMGQASLVLWLRHCIGLAAPNALPSFQLCGLLWDVCSKSDTWLLVCARLKDTIIWSTTSDSDAMVLSPQDDNIALLTDGHAQSEDIQQVHATNLDLEARIAAAQTDAELLRRIKHTRPVALLLLNPLGEIVFANDYWYDLTQHAPEDSGAFQWLGVFDDDEIPRMKQLWDDKINTSDVVCYPAKLKRRWQPPPEFSHAGNDEPMWLLVSGHTTIEDGITVGATGCFVDISNQKWLEKQQKKLLDQAIGRAELSEQVAHKTKEIVASQSRFSKLCGDLAVGVYIADAAATINYANQAYWDILGVPASKDPLVWVTAMTEESLEMAAVGFRKVYEEKVPVEGIEIKLKRHFHPSNQAAPVQGDGHATPHAWVWFQAFPELNPDGSVHQVVGCVTDISHQKWVEGFISEQKEDAVKARLQQEKFMDMTSHEMRNPIAAVIHCADEIIDILTNDLATQWHSAHRQDVLNAARTILTCSQHARRIMDDVLTFSKMGARLLKIHPVPCQPVEVFRNALNIFQGDALASAATLEYHVHESVENLKVDWVFLDQGRCIQIVANLVTNALKFVRNQRVRSVSVTVAASLNRQPMTARAGFKFLDTETMRKASTTDAEGHSDQDIFLHVIVDDTGCGIPATEQASMFGRFFQASHKTHIQYGGSGLGLSISKELAELQAGQIGFASQHSVGSTFSFYVRTTRTTPADTTTSAGPHERQTTKRAGSIPTSSSPEAPSKKILGTTMRSPLPSNPVEAPQVLLVEDNLTNQKVLQRQLLRNKHGCIVANNGVEALEAIKRSEHWHDAVDASQKLSLILLDVEMPVMGGFECVRRIRELEREGNITKHIPVIAVTANARQEQINEALQAGMDDVLCKPFQFDELLKAMQRLLS